MAKIGGGIDSAEALSLAKGLVGHGFYSSSTGTEASPLTATINNSIALDFDTVVFEDYLPSDVTTFFSGGRFRPQSKGDTYKLGVRFFAASSNNNGGFSVSLDISAAGDGSNVIAQKGVRMLRGSNEYDYYTVDLGIFSRDDFLNNGGLISAIAKDGTLSLHTAKLLAEKTTAG